MTLARWLQRFASWLTGRTQRRDPLDGWRFRRRTVSGLDVIQLVKPDIPTRKSLVVVTMVLRPRRWRHAHLYRVGRN